MSNSEDLYVRHFLESRDSAARQKIKIAEFRSRYPDGVIFSVEGVDDKHVYFHWIREVAPELAYEVYICDNKDEALKLLDALRRDQTGLAENIYFLLDRDFDGLKGRDSGPEVCLTEAYSIENYLVCRNVLDGILRVELHCHGEPKIREKVISEFEMVYGKFLEATRELNFRIYISRKASIRQNGPLPDRISDLATISLLDVTPVVACPSNVVQLEREPTDDERVFHETAFKLLKPEIHYRGKFALMFFQRWLNLLVGDRKNEEAKLFTDVERNHSPVNNFTLDMMAARTKAPPELREFLQRLAPA